jgi:hypothetical protein
VLTLKGACCTQELSASQVMPATLSTLVSSGLGQILGRPMAGGSVFYRALFQLRELILAPKYRGIGLVLRIAISVLGIVVSMVGSPAAAFAQAALTGVVRDSSGGLLPGSQWKPSAPR